MRRILRKAMSRLYLLELTRKGVVVGSGSYISGRPIVTRVPQSELSIGKRAVIESVARRQVIGVNRPSILRTLSPTAVLTIGDDCGISGASIVAQTSITIGDGCLLGADVLIIDNDFHPSGSLARRYAPRPPGTPDDAVEIGNNVFIGTRAIILPGSRIGDNSVVAAGAVVAGSFGRGILIAGVPARQVRVIDYDAG